MQTKQILPIALVVGLTLSGLAAGLSASTIRYAGPVEVVRVETISGTDYTSISRFAGVEAALASITDNSASKHYIVRLPPGKFVLSAPLVMKSYVDLEGAGQDMTTIEYYGSNTNVFTDSSSATVVAADYSELRFLTINSDATGKAHATGLYINSVSPSLSHVSVSASGGTGNNFGIYTVSGYSALTDVFAASAGGNLSYGIYAWMGGPSLTHVTGAGGFASQYNAGLYANASAFTARDSLFLGAGGFYAYGIAMNAISAAMVSETTAFANGGTVGNYGIQTYNSSATVIGVYLDASGTGSRGIETGSSGSAYTLDVRDSFVRGATNSVYNTTPNVTRIGASQLSGAVVNIAGGTLYCVVSYNSAFTPLNSLCASGGPGTPLLPPDTSGEIPAPEPPSLPPPSGE